MSFKSEGEVLQKVNEILSLSTETRQDQAFQQFVKYIFTNGLKENNISLPIKKRFKESFKFLENYVKLIHSLFKLKKDERNALYNSDPSIKISNEISELIKSLNILVNKKKEELSEILNDKSNNLNIIKSYFFNIISNQPNTIFKLLDMFHFYFILYIPSLSVVNFLMFSILKNKFNDILSKFDYKEFCPDFNNEICQNLIILFFENIKNEKREYLFIFALLIFKYEEIFTNIKEKKISKYILQYTANKTYEIVKSKTLDNLLISEYTYSEYLFNLENTIILLEEKKKNLLKKRNESTINNTHSYQNSNKNQFTAIKNNEQEEKENVETQNNKVTGENIDLKNKGIKDENTETNKNNILSSINISTGNINDRDVSEIKNANKINIIDNNNSNMNISNNKIIEENISQINKPNIIISENNEAQDIMNLPKDKIDNLTTQALYSMFRQKYSEQEAKISEQKAEISEQKAEISELKEKLSKQEEKLSVQEENNGKKFSELNTEISNLKGIISSIQIRSLAKNFLKIFKSDLNESEKQEMKKENSNKGEIILGALKRKYDDCTNNEGFMVVAEIVKKSGDTLNRGNIYAHSILFGDYEKEILEFKAKYNIKMTNAETLEKILFLIKIGISDDTFVKCFNFVAAYCDKGMTLGFLRKDNNIESYIKSKTI